MRIITSWLVVCLVVISCHRPLAGDGIVVIQGACGRLYGTVQRPAGEEEKPVAIIFHGLTGNRNEEHLLALNDSLLARGIGTVRFDFNGHGDSEGLFSQMTLDNELADARAIYDFTASLPWVDTSRISVVGHSQGGLEAGLLAGELGGRIRSAVLMVPAACIHTMAEDGRMFGSEFKPDHLPDSLALWGKGYLGRGYLESALRCHPFERTARYKGPVLVIKAGNDDSVLNLDVDRYPAHLPQAELVELPGLTHCFPEDPASPARLAAEFIARASQ